METIKDPISTLPFFYKEETTRMNNNNPAQPHSDLPDFRKYTYHFNFETVVRES